MPKTRALLLPNLDTFFFALSAVFLISGCAWFNLSPKKVLPQEVTEYVQSVNILDEDRLRQGGKLLVTAFRAGPGIEANDRMDKVAFMIVKGLSDVLRSDAPRFELLTAGTAGEAELILEGHIIRMGRSSWMQKLMFQKEHVEVAVTGKLVDRHTGRTVMVFRDARRARNKDETPKQVGLMIGQDLGAVILDSL